MVLFRKYFDFLGENGVKIKIRDYCGGKISLLALCEFPWEILRN